MPLKADTEINLTPRTLSKYIISSQHRRTGNSNKCVWIISYGDEVECFIQSISENWYHDYQAWGLMFADQALIVIGHNQKNEELKLAKFVDGSKTNVWHGYPADYMNRPQDIPATFILRIWVQKGYITKAKMAKILQGQLCNL